MTEIFIFSEFLFQFYVVQHFLWFEKWFFTLYSGCYMKNVYLVFLLIKYAFHLRV